MNRGHSEAFVDLLHDTVKAALTENVDPDLANDATQRQEGWMHVHGKLSIYGGPRLLTIERSDMRNFPESGRVGDADDIIGSVLVQDGKVCLTSYIFEQFYLVSRTQIKGETYERMPSYR
jgi:hypothetical protein